MSDRITLHYSILDRNLGSIMKLVDKLNRRAKKFHLDPMEFEIGAVKVVPIDEKHSRRMRDIAITGQVPAAQGWCFAATLQSAGEVGNVLRTVPGFGHDIPVAYRTGDPSRCEQCGIKRYRVDTYILYHAQNEQWKQVGSTCLQDLVSDAVDFNAIAKMAEIWSIVDEACSGGDDEDFGYGRRSDDLLDAEYALTWVAEAVLRFGWVSRKMSQESGKQASVDSALAAMSVQDKPCVFSGPQRCFFDKHDECTLHWKPTEEAEKLAITALEWAREWTESSIEKANKDGVDVSEYIWNLHVVLATDLIPIRSCGLVGSVIGVYQRQMERKEKERREAENNHSEWVSQIGKRADFDLTVRSLRFIAGQWGESTMYSFTDNDENIVIWFCTNGVELEVGDTVKLKGTVKAHDAFKGVKQTILSRCKVVG